MGLFGEDGTLLEKWSIPTRVENNGVNIIPDIAASVKEKMAETGLSREEVAGVGIGVPGPVDDSGVTHRAVNLHWEKEFNVAKELSDLLDGMLVRAGNDANVAGLGEAWAGAGRGYRHIMLLTLGTGIGGAIIVDEKIYTGITGSAGEIGHTFISDDTKEICNCGNSGCLEQYGSATGVVRMLREELASSDEPCLMRGTKLTAKDFWEAVKKGDALCIRVAEKFGRYMGRALSVAAGILNPELFIIGGGMSMSGDVVLDYIKKEFEKHIFHACRNVKFVRAELGNDGGIYGCARLVLGNE
ncbi:MAG: ROK family protein [Lachnospiraceae bacterium]|nr:ROK family protein [Lachnospiraceae bacterium]